MVYRHPSIVHHFCVRVWCTVSQDYDKTGLLLEILSGLENDVSNKHLNRSEDDMADAIRRHLKGKPYLIVLDDVWDMEAWDSLKLSFPDDKSGSRILVTSRNENVASQIIPQSQTLHHLRSLTDEESWKLLQMRISFEEGCPPELVARGQAIAQRCKGLPLTIVTVAGLHSNMETSGWEEVEESLNKSCTPALDQWKETIELSYRHLPDYLKPCSLYFGAYKEDQRIRVRELLERWIAEGFVERTAGGCVEDVAEAYLTELVQRNLVMVAERGSRGKIKFCMLHDLLHEFYKEKSIGDHFLQRLHGSELGTSAEPNMSYRLFIDSSREEDVAEPKQVFPYLRTLFIPNNNDNSSWDERHRRGILYKFCRSKLVRVLDCWGMGFFDIFPRVVLQLAHLKYLRLGIGAELFMLTPLIVNLSSLEILSVVDAPATVLCCQIL
ncbi:OLC1v1000555C1 [Oldenlandia corymbosa var. corymbosa]|uniref:OLC1v1000555C1 n=1 Tax=Oldenlandia corymbosa var. corymbosa TaxID=529605 RepID=A0AAV1D3Z3_OLDCO|nr:OLC1v1000555C1 [Oldenlandia corymbosa var. corymbosa]